jgi:hypothetical protein
MLKTLILFSNAIFSTIAVGAVTVFCASAQDQPLPLNSQIRTFGIVGLAPGQAAQLNVVNPGLPAPFLPIICTARLSFVDDQNVELKSSATLQVLPGKSVSLVLNKDTEDPGTDGGRVPIRAIVRTPPLGPGSDNQMPAPNAYCPLVLSLELFNANSGRTNVVLGGSQIVFPRDTAAPAPAQ